MNYNNSYSLGQQSGGQWETTGGASVPDPNMLLQQIQQLQKTVQQLQTNTQQQQQQQAGPPPPSTWGTAGAAGARGGYGGTGYENGGNSYGHGATPGTQGYSNYSYPAPPRQTRPPKTETKDGEDSNIIPQDEQKVLLVSNIPSNLANPDSLFYAFEKFGTVERVKVLHNKRNTALIQMSQPSEAQKAVDEQDKINRVGSEIYVNFSSKFKYIKLPEVASVYDDGLTKDFTGNVPNNGLMPSLTHQPPPPQPQTPSYNMPGNNNGLHSSMSFPPSSFGNPGAFSGPPPNFGPRMGTPGSFMGNPGSFPGGPDMGSRPREPIGGMGGGVVLLVSNIPDEIAKVNNIFNMIGMYGDVLAVKILRNKKDCALVQTAKPHHAQQVRNFLDQAKVGGKKLCISYSHVESLMNKRIPEDDELQMDFSTSRNHRYRNHSLAAKLTKNLGPPSSTLHVANLPEELTHVEVKDMFIERGFTVKESKECGANGTMALLTMTGPDEALMALATMHNYAPEEYKFKNTAGLCVSFSSARNRDQN